ncbi:MAG: hypothetical protein ACFFDW_05765 [Candidatus Thorarchaeota archaeon]
MRKGPLIASAIEGVIGLAMIIVGSVFYDSNLTNWNDWVLWFGIVLIGLALIIMVVAFIKKPGEEGAKEEKTE